MPPDRTHPLLNAFADGELPPWAAARVRRHLKTCPECRAEYEAIQALGAQARAWRDVAAPAALETRIADAIARLSAAQENTPMPSTAIPLAPFRPRFGLRWQPLAGAGALAATLAAAALLLPGSPGRPTAAFADVQRAMRLVGAVSWTETQTRDKGGRVILHNTHRFWVRRAPAAVAEWDSASTLPQVPGEEYAGPTKSLSNAHGQVYFHTQEGVYYLHPTPGIQREVAETINGLTQQRAGDYGSPERVTLDGHPALRFHQQAPDYDVTVWADPRTLRVVRKHTDMVAHFPTGAEHIVLDAAHFRYDSPAPDGVFDLTTPPNAHVTEDDGRGNKTVKSMPPQYPKARGNATPATGTSHAAFVINGFLWVTSPDLPKWVRPAPTSDLLITIKVTPDYHQQGVVSQTGHDFRLRALGHPDVRASLDGWTYGSDDFESFGLHLASPGRAKMAPGVAYTIVPVGTPGTRPWEVTPGVRIRLK